MAGQGNVEEVRRRRNATHPRTRRRRWLQFSLRTALLFMVLWAVLLGAWRVYVAPYERRERVVALLREKGVAKFWYHKEGGLPGWLAWVVGGESLGRRVSGVTLPSGIGNQDLAEFTEAVAQLPWLTGLILDGTQVTDDGLVHLAGLVNLEDLIIDRTPTRGEGLRHLRPLKRLRFFHTTNSPLTDEALRWLGEIRSLENLNLMYTEITDAGLPHLAGLGRLKVLSLLGSRVTDDVFHHLGVLPELMNVNLQRTKVTGSGFAHLNPIPPRLWNISLEKRSIMLEGGRWVKTPPDGDTPPP